MNDRDALEVRATLDALQAAVRAREAALGDENEGPQRDLLLRVRETQVVNPHQPIGWPVMPAGLFPRLRAYTQKIVRRLLRWYIDPLIAEQNQYNAAAADFMSLVQAEADQTRDRLSWLERQTSEASSNWQRRHAQDMETLSLRLQRLELARESERISAAPTPAAPPSQQGAPIDYFVLGAKFRNRIQMGDWLADYDDLWLSLKQKWADQNVPLPPVLDIGCGRGDYVEHLLALGLHAYGIDLDPAALTIGRSRGLDVRAEDAFAHLTSVPDASLSAVVMIQVIEHFKPQTALELFRVIARKLKPGGFVLAETINPSCLYALSNWYLIDPSHETPVHSEMARFLLEQAGFERVETRFLHPMAPAAQLQPVVTGGPHACAETQLLAERLQPSLNRLNEVLFGPQDYGIIGYAPAAREGKG